MTYNDRSLDDSALSSVPLFSRKGVTVPFPVKLHRLIEHAEAAGLTDIVGWQPHGRCFVIRDPDAFCQELLPRYVANLRILPLVWHTCLVRFFRQTKFASFRRQLNLYGFSRLTQGPDVRGYYHELFLRGMESMAYRIARLPINGRGARGKATPELEPDFYAMESLGDVASLEEDYLGFDSEEEFDLDFLVDADDKDAFDKGTLFQENFSVANIWMDEWTPKCSVFQGEPYGSRL